MMCTATACLLPVYVTGNRRYKKQLYYLLQACLRTGSIKYPGGFYACKNCFLWKPMPLKKLNA